MVFLNIASCCGLDTPTPLDALLTWSWIVVGCALFLFVESAWLLAVLRHTRWTTTRTLLTCLPLILGALALPLALHLRMLWLRFGGYLGAIRKTPLTGADLAAFMNAYDAALQSAVNIFCGLGALVLICTVALLMSGMLYRASSPRPAIAARASTQPAH